MSLDLSMNEIRRLIALVEAAQATADEEAKQEYAAIIGKLNAEDDRLYEECEREASQEPDYMPQVTMEPFEEREI